ncbi:hypothetical protein ACTFIV_011293, partial [Dictyostelium citrinum]
VYKIFYNLYW